MADKVVVLDCGVVVEEGTHRELLHKKGAYAALYSELCRQESGGPGEKI